MESNSTSLRLDLGYPEAELVFGLVYAVGTDYTGVQLTLENYLKRFNYKPHIVKLSDFIRKVAPKINIGVNLDETTEANRIDTFMTAGDNLCDLAKHEAFLMSAAIAEINQERIPSKDRHTDEPMAKTAHIFLSLKRPQEVELLRAVYGAGFFLIGVFASENERFHYLTEDKNIPKKETLRLMKRDEEEEITFGQRSRKTFQLADVFIKLGGDEHKEQLERFLDLIFGNPFLTPELDEHAMFLAYSASLRSGQLGRQVGAAIVSAGGDIMAVGCNDVPKAEGGLYWPGAEDARDHVLGFDSNDIEQVSIVKDLVKRLGLKMDYNTALGLLKKSRLMDITEYGRAVHAEMDALLTCARVGVSPTGGKLYTTTFPCHNCTRHLIAAGIKKVIYIEPYPKSLASKLHKDSIELPGTHAFKKRDGGFRIPFEAFVGIGPRRFYDLFSMGMSSGYPVERKKENGRVLNWRRDGSSPRVQMLPTSYIEREKLTAATFKSTIDRIAEGQHGIQRLPFEQKKS
jgi:deoxycytidylate deaminase